MNHLSGNIRTGLIRPGSGPIGMGMKLRKI